LPRVSPPGSVGKNSSGDLREMDTNAAYKDELIIRKCGYKVDANSRNIQKKGAKMIEENL
jgi:hypothetical protein